MTGLIPPPSRSDTILDALEEALCEVADILEHQLDHARRSSLSAQEPAHASCAGRLGTLVETTTRDALVRLDEAADGIELLRALQFDDEAEP